MVSVRRGRLVVYGARLERGFTRKGIEGSNPSPSATIVDFMSKILHPSASRAISLLQTMQDTVGVNKLAFWVAPNTILTLAGARGFCDGVYYSENSTTLSRWHKEIKEGVGALKTITSIIASDIEITSTSMDERYASYTLLLREGLEYAISSSTLIDHEVLKHIPETATGEEMFSLLQRYLAPSNAANLGDEQRSHILFGTMLGYPDTAILDHVLEKTDGTFKPSLVGAYIRGADYYSCPIPVYDYHSDLIGDSSITAHEKLWSKILHDYYTSEFHTELESDISFNAKLIEIGNK
jgi:hypothetical protein